MTTTNRFLSVHPLAKFINNAKFIDFEFDFAMCHGGYLCWH